MIYIAGKCEDLTGMRFGRLVVIERVEDYISPSGFHAPKWSAKCDCGNIIETTAKSLKSGSTKSCGCLHREISAKMTHKCTLGGYSKKYPRIYGAWHNMIKRCEDANNKSYHNYGGRGISVCDEWHTFKNFFDWAITNGYKDNLTLDRIDNNLSYSPDNCRWATYKDQENNTRRNRMIEYKGENKTISQWAEKYSLPYTAVVHRLKRGWDIETALLTPLLDQFIPKKYK